MRISETKLREFIQTEETQYHERKSLLVQRTGLAATPRDRATVRDQIAEYVAGFANAEGGTLILGVEDDGRLTGHQYPPDVIDIMLRVPETRLTPPQARGYAVALDDHELIVFDVEGATRAVMVQGDGFPYRIGDTTVAFSEQSINSIKDQGLVESAEARPSRARLRDLDEVLIARAARSAGMDETEVSQFLLARRLADRHGSDLVLRQAAELLFARDATTIAHPNAGVRIFRVDGTTQETGARRNVQEFPRLEGNLPGVLARVRQLLDTLIQKSAKLHDLFFQEMPEYPALAWQEAVVNAVAHRDYAVQGQCVEIWLYDDRLEVSSPGAPPAEVAIADLKLAKPAHASRNPRIARVLAEIGLMRDQGEGIPRMFEEMEVSFLPVPELDVVAGKFRVVLRNEPIFRGADPAWSRAVRALPLSVAQKRALVGLRGHDFANSDYGELNVVDRDTAYRDLHDLLDRGLLTTSGAGAGTRYHVLESAIDAGGARSPLAQLIARMEDGGFVTNTDYREAFATDRNAAKIALATWTRQGVLVREGEKRGTKYRKGGAWPPG